jgi:hypothetical protein
MKKLNSLNSLAAVLLLFSTLFVLSSETKAQYTHLQAQPTLVSMTDSETWHHGSQAGILAVRINSLASIGTVIEKWMVEIGNWNMPLVETTSIVSLKPEETTEYIAVEDWMLEPASWNNSPETIERDSDYQLESWMTQPFVTEGMNNDKEDEPILESWMNNPQEWLANNK